MGKCTKDTMPGMCWEYFTPILSFELLPRKDWLDLVFPSIITKMKISKTMLGE